MVTKRTPLRRNLRRRVNNAAIQAWKAGDYLELHRALGLKPWERSPLPRSLNALGVDPEDNPPPPDSTWLIDESWQQAIDLQRELLAVAGMPECAAEDEDA